MFLSNLDLNKPGSTTISDAVAGHDARLLAEIAGRLTGRPLLHIAVDDVRAANLTEWLAFFAPQIEVIAFPAWDCLPYDRVSPQADLVAQRILTLMRLGKPFTRPAIVITTVAAAMQRVLAPEMLADSSLAISLGDTLPIERLRQFLSTNGYHPTATVREAGEFAVRGGIVDLYPPSSNAPLRLDFFGDEVEAIRAFDPASQTTTEKRDNLFLAPVSEIVLNERSIAHFRSQYRALFGVAGDNDPLYEAVSAGRKFPGAEHWLGLFYPKMQSLFSYVPTSPVSYDYQATEAIAARRQQIDDFYQARCSLYEAARKNKSAQQTSALYKPAPIESLYIPDAELRQLEQDRVVLHLSPFTKPEGAQGVAGQGKAGQRFFKPLRVSDDTEGQNDKSDAGAQYELLREAIAEHQAHNRRVVIACYSEGSAERLTNIMRHHGIDEFVRCDDWDAFRKQDAKRIAIALLPLDTGFQSPDLFLVAEQDLLGDRLTHAPKKRRAAASQFKMELATLASGDFVVHAEHGIGRYEGLETIQYHGMAHDCVRLIYSGGDKLFVPVENLEVLSRYSSAEAGAVLDKLGGAGWQERKARVKKRLKDMAEALMKVAAARELRKGEIINVPQGAYDEFAARFPYNETEDQQTAIDATLENLASGKPMDRLVCGDVGFGKTEIALRAAFATVQSGLQVVVVVPTTLLARQHYNNFVNRFRGFPVRIAQLSRLVSAKDAKQTKEAMKAGDVDIVVGTHALLSKDVAFRNLGLMIIDEEQHFGVKQKERLKEFRSEVHVLTLTATPIPRTLQLALTGVRELSLITTPPLDRMAVRTFVLPFDPVVIRDAMMREHYRGGQSFCVCPRIEDLDKMAEELRALVPEVKIVSAHGRMPPTQLEDIMTAFDAREFDVLLATNIIESGLDIPNANTMIIHRSDLFGLAQLYQLRGRVGRGKLRGYAYLTYASQGLLSPTAQQRLEVIQSLDHLGAGFQLASHDMDIRGAGNLLGEEQSGHIREVGAELYQQMLQEAVDAVRRGDVEQLSAAVAHDWTPQINLGMSVLIPEHYVTDLGIRLGLYRRLADMREVAEVEAFAAEMIDRFGALPPEVENLLETVKIKQMCREAGIEKIDVGPKGAVIAFRNNNFKKPERLIDWIGRQSGTAKVTPDQKLVLMRVWNDAPARLQGTQKILGDMVKLAA